MDTWVSKVGEVIAIDANEQFITQREHDSDVYFIITGRVKVNVHD